MGTLYGPSNRQPVGSMTTGSLLGELGKILDRLPISRRDQLLSKATGMDLVEALRQAIIDDGRAYNAIAVEAGVAPAQVGRFVRGERDVSLSTAAKLAAALGLSLVKSKGKKSN